MPSIQCRKVKVNGGKIYVTVGKTEYEFESRKEAREFCREVLDETLASNLMVAALLAWALTQGDTESAIQAIETKRVVLDFRSANGNVLRIV